MPVNLKLKAVCYTPFISMLCFVLIFNLVFVHMQYISSVVDLSISLSLSRARAGLVSNVIWVVSFSIAYYNDLLIFSILSCT